MGVGKGRCAERLWSCAPSARPEGLISLTGLRPIWLPEGALPAGVTVSHKYGLLDDELHDAAILSASAGSYVLVVYTKGTGLADVPQRTAVIHDITKAVTAALF